METAVWELGIILKPCHIFGEHFVAHIKLLNDDAYWDISKLFPPPITHSNPRGKNVNCVTLDRIEAKVHFNILTNIEIPLLFMYLKFVKLMHDWLKN